MSKCRSWIKDAKGIEQRELLRGNWKSSGEAWFRINQGSGYEKC